MEKDMAKTALVTGATDGVGRVVAKALGKDFKGKVSVVFYAAAIPLLVAAPLASLMAPR